MGAKANEISQVNSYENGNRKARSTRARGERNRPMHGVDAAEISHRVRNLVAVIQSVSRLTMRHCSTVAEFNERFSSRLSSRCVALDHLIANDWQAMSIHQQVRAQLENFGILDTQVSAEGPNIFLAPEGVHHISLALHELITNAMKHGALSVPHGRVKLTWAISNFAGQQRFEMAWREIDGPPVSEPTRQGFGRLLLEKYVASALSGTSKCEFLGAGFKWELDVPQIYALEFGELDSNVGAPSGRL